MVKTASINEYDVMHTANGVIRGEIKVDQLSFVKHGQQRGSTLVYAPTLNSFLDYLLEYMPEPKRGMASSDPGYGDFNKFKTYEECIDVFRNRPHTLAKFAKKEDQLFVRDAPGTETYYDVTGDYVDMGRFMDGEPECFGNMSMGNPYNYTATIILNISTVWYVHQEVMNHRARRILRMINWLEAKKIRCRLIALSSTQCATVEVEVKQTHEPLDINTIAVATHSEFLRRLEFRVAEYSKTWDWGYGTAMSIRKGYMTIPDLGQHGIVIYTETRDTIEETDNVWDAAEKEITEGIQQFGANMQIYA